MTSHMRDEINLMVSRISGIFVAFQPYSLITRIIELAKKKKYDRDYTSGRIASSMIGIFSITYAHNATLSIVTLTE